MCLKESRLFSILYNFAIEDPVFPATFGFPIGSHIALGGVGRGSGLGRARKNKVGGNVDVSMAKL